MAIKARDQVKWVESDTEFELEADTGEAFLVKDIMIGDGAYNYVTVSIDKTTVGYFRADGGRLGNHVHFPLVDSEKLTLLGYLMEKGIFKGYPVAEGQSMVVTSEVAVAMCIVYDIYEPGDISPDMENGSEAKEYMLINYGRVAATADLAEGDNLYEYSKLPSEFPNFPFGKDVPAKTTINIYGILASDIGRTTDGGSNKQISKYLKLIKEREVLFDEDKRGLMLIGDAPASDTFNIGTYLSCIGNYSSVDKRLPLLFSEPLTFMSGEELSVVVNSEVLSGSANITGALSEVGIIERVIRTE